MRVAPSAVASSLASWTAARASGATRSRVGSSVSEGGSVAAASAR
jgi:hypothetical protein